MNKLNRETLIEIFHNIEGAIFDLDGTLLDSMGIWDDIDQEYLKNKGLPLPQNLKRDIEHLSFTETAEYFKSRFNISDSIDSIEKEWYDMAFNKYSNNTMIRPYAKEFLELLKSNGIKIALATSNYRSISEIALKRNNIYELFDVIITTEDVKRGKDFPDIYMFTSKKLNLPAKKCVVFEDSLPAIKAASTAGMWVISVKDSYCPHSWELLLYYSNSGITNFSQLINII